MCTHTHMSYISHKLKLDLERLTALHSSSHTGAAYACWRDKSESPGNNYSRKLLIDQIRGYSLCPCANRPASNELQKEDKFFSLPVLALPNQGKFSYRRHSTKRNKRKCKLPAEFTWKQKVAEPKQNLLLFFPNFLVIWVTSKMHNKMIERDQEQAEVLMKQELFPINLIAIFVIILLTLLHVGIYQVFYLIMEHQRLLVMILFFF